jgi:hypothetical protein
MRQTGFSRKSSGFLYLSSFKNHRRLPFLSRLFPLAEGEGCSAANALSKPMQLGHRRFPRPSSGFIGAGQIEKPDDLTARVFWMIDGRDNRLLFFSWCAGAKRSGLPTASFYGMNLKFMPYCDILKLALLTMVAVVLPLRTEGSFFCSPKSSDEGRAALWLHTKRSLRTL